MRPFASPLLPQNQLVLEGSRALDLQLGSQDEDDVGQSENSVHKQ